MEKKYYAHSIEGKPPSEWQPLEEQLKNVAEIVRSSSEHFDIANWLFLSVS